MVKKEGLSKSGKMRLKRVGILSIANIIALIYLVMGVLYFIAGIVSKELVYESFLSGLMGFFILIISFTFGAWVVALFCAWLYNLFSQRLGGIELELN